MSRTYRNRPLYQHMFFNYQGFPLLDPVDVSRHLSDRRSRFCVNYYSGNRGLYLRRERATRNQELRNAVAHGQLVKILGYVRPHIY